MDSVNPDIFQPSAQAEADKGLAVRFYMKTIQDNPATMKAGRPIFKEREYVDIKVPGDRNSGWAGPARQEHQNRFPEHYRMFKSRVGNEEQIIGTLLTEWALMPRSLVEELGYFNVRTLEELIAMPDVHAQKFAQIHGWKDKAKLHMQAAKDEAPALELQDKLAERDALIANLTEQVATLTRKMDEAPAPAPVDASAAEMGAMLAEMRAMKDAMRVSKAEAAAILSENTATVFPDTTEAPAGLDPIEVIEAEADTPKPTKRATRKSK